MTNQVDTTAFEYLHDMNAVSTDALELATNFVNRTNQNIFLTGKAGTGKTTFLQSLAQSTYKRFAIVAPTGIAALNAGGVTIHSQFLFPLATFVPERNYNDSFPENFQVCTRDELTRRHPLNSKRRKVLRSLDLLIIDEVSMVRPDLLDAIDFRLRQVKRNYNQPFGGVQLLMIGDLYQLPPVIKDDEWRILSKYYRTPFFFDAVVLQNGGFTYIELDKIFRQSDENFVRILNNLRDNRSTSADIDELNKHFQTESQINQLEEVITLTTHNYQAEQMNDNALAALTTREMTFRAQIEGDFPKNMHPVLEELKLKVGAQIMFVKNDNTNGHYFNGKLATVVDFDDDDHRITVEMAGDKRPFTLRREVWENKRYEVNSATGEKEEVILGSFAQYPVKLAWAITVHKSQGLSFDRAIIDVGKAFAAGQVYVALSRLRSLDGLILLTRINPGVIATDPDVVEFSGRQPAKNEVEATLHERQVEYLQLNLTAAFSFKEIVQEIDRIIVKYAAKFEFEDDQMQGVLEKLSGSLQVEEQNLSIFRRQIVRLLREEDANALTDRLRKATEYYDKQLREHMLELLTYMGLVEQFARVKTYLGELEELDLAFMNRREAIGKSAYLADRILLNEPIDKVPSAVKALKEDRAELLKMVRGKVSNIELKAKNKTGRKQPTGQTYQDSYALFLQGKSIKEVAAIRGLKPSTIETHLLRGISDGVLQRQSLLDDDALAEILKVIEQLGSEAGLKELFDALLGKYSYIQIRMAKRFRLVENTSDPSQS